jgi:D-alanyl-D-alanine carboxypeptidase/D-alanyl-D-alanine-endopeptidase (penicillin-binding protein 4)
VIQSIRRLSVLMSVCAGLLLLPAIALAGAKDPLRAALALPQASLLVMDGGNTLHAKNIHRPMIPASTMKLLTALAAIERWGLEHRFKTHFYLGKDGRLWVRGMGDPNLDTEELTRIAMILSSQGLGRVRGIGLDDSHFASNLKIPGRSNTLNPYDAPVTALAANYNTIHLKNHGKMRSAEAEAPLTSTAAKVARGLGRGQYRVNLRNQDNSVRYFGELLAARLEAQGIRVSGDIQVGAVPRGARRFYTHENSRNLGQVVRSMLRYSNNFVANDLFLLLGDRQNGRPLDIGLSSEYMTQWTRRRFGWKNFRIEEGAGLSRGNRLSAQQLIELLEAFKPYRHLMPRQRNNDAVMAKTGTLTGVSTYAGYVQRGDKWATFSLMINQPVSGNLRKQVASSLVYDSRRVADLCTIDRPNIC